MRTEILSFSDSAPWRKTHTPGIYGGCSLETWIWRLWDGVLMILKSYGNHLSIYMQHHWDHSVQLWSWALVVWGSRKFICGIVCAQESWFLLVAKVFVAVLESCLYWTCVVMAMSQAMCLLMWTEVSSTRCSPYLFIWSIGCRKYEERILRLVLYLTLHHHFQIMWCLMHRFLSSLRNMRKKLEHKASENFGHQELSFLGATLLEGDDNLSWCSWPCLLMHLLLTLLDSSMLDHYVWRSSCHKAELTFKASF